MFAYRWHPAGVLRLPLPSPFVPRVGRLRELGLGRRVLQRAGGLQRRAFTDQIKRPALRRGANDQAPGKSKVELLA
jgi:hypothetical protein